MFSISSFFFNIQIIWFVELTGNLCSVHIGLPSGTLLYAYTKHKARIDHFSMHSSFVFENEGRFDEKKMLTKSTRVNKADNRKLLTYLLFSVDCLCVVSNQLQQIDLVKKSNVCMSIHDILYVNGLFRFFSSLTFKRSFDISTYFYRMLGKEIFTSLPVGIDRILDWCTRVHKMPYTHKPILEWSQLGADAHLHTQAKV